MPENTAPEGHDKGRLHALDGIRGYAALSVVLFHIFYEMFGVIHPEFRSPYLYFLMNGKLAVAVFFVLSGQALSVQFLKRRDYEVLDRMVVKRYLRLAIPSLASCFIIYCILKLGLNYNKEAGAILGREEWLGSAFDFTPSVLHLLHDVFIDVFVTKSEYNGFLWTMKYELIGSFAVFAALYCYKWIKYPVVVFTLMAAALWFFSYHIACFFIGMAFAQLYVDGFMERLKTIPAWIYASAVLLIAVIAANYLVALYDIRWGKLMVFPAAALVLIGQSNKWFEAFLTLKVSRFFGTISFPLYLVHLAILVSPMSYLVVRAAENGPITIATAIAIGTVSFVLCIIAAWMFLPVEKFTGMVTGKIAKIRFLRPDRSR